MNELTNKLKTLSEEGNHKQKKVLVRITTPWAVSACSSSSISFCSSIFLSSDNDSSDSTTLHFDLRFGRTSSNNLRYWDAASLRHASWQIFFKLLILLIDLPCLQISTGSQPLTVWMRMRTLLSTKEFFIFRPTQLSRKGSAADQISPHLLLPTWRSHRTNAPLTPLVLYSQRPQPLSFQRHDLFEKCLEFSDHNAKQ